MITNAGLRFTWKAKYLVVQSSILDKMAIIIAETNSRKEADGIAAETLAQIQRASGGKMPRMRVVELKTVSEWVNAQRVK